MTPSLPTLKTAFSADLDSAYRLAERGLLDLADEALKSAQANLNGMAELMMKEPV